MICKGVALAGPVWTQLLVEIRASGSPVHNQKLGYTAFSGSSHTGREKFATGPIIVPVPIGGPVLNTLIGLRWLDDRQAEDRVAVGDAIAAMLSDLAEHHR